MVDGISHRKEGAMSDLINNLLEGKIILDEEQYNKLVEENDCLKAKILYLEGQITGMKEATYQRFVSSAKREIKKVAKPTKKIIKKAQLAKPQPTELDRSIAQRMSEGIRNVIGESRRSPSIDSWSNDIRLMRERDNLLPSLIMETFIWANRDPFWKTNILSPRSLRKHWDTLRAKLKTSEKHSDSPRNDDNMAYIKERMGS